MEASVNKLSMPIPKPKGGRNGAGSCTDSFTLGCSFFNRSTIVR